MEKNYCEYCESIIDENEVYCEACQEDSVCEKCGCSIEIGTGEVYCYDCGEESYLEGLAEIEEMKREYYASQF